MANVTNKRSFLATLQAAKGEAERRFAEKVKNVIYTLHTEIVERTPVWSGSAIANYQWSVGIPALDYIDPVDNGPPGHTNEMEIGTEPRRPPNLELANASLLALNLKNPYKMFWLTNNDPDIMDIEDGVLPPEPLRIRAAEGMIRVSFEYVVAKLAAGQL